MNSRRSFLGSVAALGSAGLALPLGLYPPQGSAFAGGGYKAIVVLHLDGGHDGNDVLVPMDGGFGDYEKSRPSIALRRDTLMPFPGKPLGHTLGLNRALSPLMRFFDREELAFLVNAGPLVKPTSAQEMREGRATLPPFLFAHPEQIRYVQGWMADEDPSGWGGRAIEAMNPGGSWRSPLVSVGSAETLVTGQRSRMVEARVGHSRNMGRADMTDPHNRWTQLLESLGRQQSQHPVEAEFARSLRGVFEDARELALMDRDTPEPAGRFQDDPIGQRLRLVARMLPFYRSQGVPRQIIAIKWGQFDTHAGQRNGAPQGNADPLDVQYASLAAAIAAFQDSVQALGMGEEVLLLVNSEFGRTLDPAAGFGSDHAWGNHWMVLGGAVAGGRFHGDRFPSLVLGGADDGDRNNRGYWVPQIASDQVAAELLLWLGLPASALVRVMPNLANFSQKTVGFVHG